MPRALYASTRILLLILGLLALTSTARADALVVVEISGQGERPVDGRVTLRSRDGSRTYECSTEEGRCSIDGVQGGSYVVTLAPERGQAPPARRVIIPPAGRVELHLAVAE